MRIKEISSERASIWFSVDELTFLIATIDRVFKELHPDEFSTRTGRLAAYAKELATRVRNANDRLTSRQGARNSASSPQGGAPVAFIQDLDDDYPLDARFVTMRIEFVSGDKVLLSLTDHELRFLNNALNEAIHGIRRGNEEFIKSTGKTREYGRKLMKQLMDANDKIEERR
jgi:hypothetical protein